MSAKTNTNRVARITNYTISEIKDKMATIQISGTTEAETAMQSGMKISTKINGEFSGEAKVDIKTGVVQSLLLQENHQERCLHWRRIFQAHQKLFLHQL